MPAFDENELTQAEYEQAVADFIGNNENDNTGDYNAHFDGGDSIALGYGLDLLANDNNTINDFLRDAELPELTQNQQNQLDTIRQNQTTMTNQQLRDAADNLNLNLNQQQASDLLNSTLESYRDQLENRLNTPPYNIDINDIPLSNIRVALLEITRDTHSKI